MKFQFIKHFLILFLLSSVVLTGCLKDGYFNDGQTQAYSGGTTQTIGLDINALSATNFSFYPIGDILHDTIINFVQVELGGPTSATQDITVTLDTSSAILDSFNNVVDVNGDPAPIGPGDLYNPGTIEIVNPVIVIPKGQRTAWLQIKFIPHDYIGLDVALGFFIKSISPSGYTVSANQSSGAVQVIIENKYDGKYALTILTTGWSAYGVSDGPPANTWPGNTIYASTGTFSNTINAPGAGPGWLVAFDPGGGVLNFGNAIPNFHLDPVTNELASIDNLNEDSRHREFHPNPAYTTGNGWDEATGNIYLAYIVTQDGRPPMNVFDTLIFKGRR